ncbi:MAG: hypothetical protein KBH30_03330, partial [Ferruginibacter sp.]|nr:hypothetical protein [Ferruginibacter sp.]
FKETINNAVKYSKGNTIRVEFSIFNQYFKMTISDNGKGFDQQEVRMGNGLKNMADRAKNINANLIISSLPGNGTTLELSCPV